MIMFYSSWPVHLECVLFICPHMDAQEIYFHYSNTLAKHFNIFKSSQWQETIENVACTHIPIFSIWMQYCNLTFFKWVHLRKFQIKYQYYLLLNDFITYSYDYGNTRTVKYIEW